MKRLGLIILIGLLAGCGGESSGAGAHVDKDCSDFSTQQEAQAYFDSLGGSPSNNADGLDGDTIRVQISAGIIIVRLSEIDCPEKNQAFGAEATQFTTSLALGEFVDLNASATDRFGRSIAYVILPGGINLNRALLNAGLAWWFEAFSNDLSLRDLERAARAKRAGLWQDNNPVPPWDFRS